MYHDWTLKSDPPPPSPQCTWSRAAIKLNFRCFFPFVSGHARPGSSYCILSDIDLPAGGLPDPGGGGVGQRSPVQWRRGLIEPQLLVAVLQKLWPPRFSSTWKRLSGWSVPPHRKLSGANTEPLIRNSFSTEQLLSAEGGGPLVCFCHNYNNCKCMMKWAIVLTLAGALCCPLEEGKLP